MITVVIPAYNEQAYLNKTIENVLSTAEGCIEVIVMLNGYDQEVDARAIVVKNRENLGMRKALNRAAKIAGGEHLMFIDAHCNISERWDTKMLEPFEQYPNGIVVAPITAINKDFTGGRGWYGFCEMRPNMQPVWKGKKKYRTIEPNMGLTGCGLMMARSFYLSFGGLDESLPKMGAIGSEFSIHGWLDGDGIYTRTDVLLGHIFGTGGYDTSQATKAQEILYERYGDRYTEILSHFSERPGKMSKPRTTKEHRTVIVDRRDEHVTTDTQTGKPIKKVVEFFKYVYEDNGGGPSEEEIAKRYGPKASKVGEETYYPAPDGQWVKVA